MACMEIFSIVHPLRTLENSPAKDIVVQKNYCYSSGDLGPVFQNLCSSQNLIENLHVFSGIFKDINFARLCAVG